MMDYKGLCNYLSLTSQAAVLVGTCMMSGCSVVENGLPGLLHSSIPGRHFDSVRGVWVGGPEDNRTPSKNPTYDEKGTIYITIEQPPKIIPEEKKKLEEELEKIMLQMTELDRKKVAPYDTSDEEQERKRTKLDRGRR